MSQEIDLDKPEVFNRQLLDAIASQPDGMLKNASESSSRMVRRRIRENAFGRLILPFKPVTDADLNQLPGTELPVIIEEMEPESPGAKAVSFNDTADTAFYRGDKFVIYFCNEQAQIRQRHRHQKDDAFSGVNQTSVNMSSSSGITAIAGTVRGGVV